MSSDSPTRLVRPFDHLMDAEQGWRIDTDDLEGLDVLGDAIRLEATGRQVRLADDDGTFGGVLAPKGVQVWGDNLLVCDPEGARVLWWSPATEALKVVAVDVGDEGLDAPEGIATGVGLEQPPGADDAPAPRELRRPVALCVDGLDRLYIVDETLRRVMVVGLDGLQLHRHITADEPWQPVDIDVGANGELYVADAAAGRIRVFEPGGRQLSDAAYPGGPLRPDDDAIPYRVVVEEFGAVVLAEHDGQQEFTLLGEDGTPIPLEPRRLPDALRKHAAGVVRRGGGVHSDAEIVERVVLHRLADTPRSRAVGRHDNRLQITGWAGEEIDTGLRVRDDGRLASVPDDQGRDDDSMPRVSSPGGGPLYRREGVMFFEPLDAGRQDHSWHRVVLQVDTPERTSVQLLAATSSTDDIALPDPEDIDAGQPGADWRMAPLNADEWLLPTDEGRFLTLGVRFRGPRDATPSLKRVVVYARRDTSMKFLPSVYRTNRATAEAVGPLVALTDTVFDEIEQGAEDFGEHLDVDRAPADTLRWLASWFGLKLRGRWPEETRRRILDEIIELYEMRGTVEGLRRLVQLHTGVDDPMPVIVEHFRAHDDPRMLAVLGDAEDHRHHFSIFLPECHLAQEGDVAVLRRLVADHAPAHTDFSLVPITPGIRVGGPGCPGSVLGVDSLVGSPRGWRLPDGDEFARRARSILGRSTITDDFDDPPDSGGSSSDRRY